MRAEWLRGWLVVLGLIGAAGAAAATGWQSLDVGRRQLLAPFERVWPDLPEPLREQILANAEHWQRLDPLAQARLQQRHAEWLTLPAEQRQRIRARHAIWRALPEARRQALQARRSAFMTLSTDDRAARRQAFLALPAAQRNALLLAPERRALAGLARKLFPFVPAEQQESTLAMLDALGETARAELERGALRLPPWQREALRVELLETPVAERAARLRQRLR